MNTKILKVVSLLLLIFTINSFTPHRINIDEIVKNMTLEQKVGQLFMVAFKGEKLPPSLKDIINNYHIGGVILFSRNVTSPEQLATLCNHLQNVAMESKTKIPLFIAIDQEGGPTSQLYDVNGFTSTISNMAIGAIGKEAAAYKHARLQARELRVVGINMNLAPVVDVNNNPDNPIINIRSYSENPDEVAKLAKAAIRGYQDNGIIATVKHFPGHGDTTIDSHVGLPRVDYKLDRLERIELKPFKAAIEEDVAAIMTAHIVYPELDKKGYPATLSRKILTDLLRKRLNFNNIIITDAMEMKAIANNYGEIEATELAVKAGADIILVCDADSEIQKKRITAIIEKVKKGEILESEINEKVKRILKIKNKFNIFNNYQVDIKKIKNEVNTEESINESLQLARESITLIKNEGNLIPLKLKENDKILVISPSKKNINPTTSWPLKLTNTIGEELKKIYNNINVEEILISTRPTDEQIEECVDEAKHFDTIIVTTLNAHFSPQQIELIKKLKDKKLIIVAVGMPYDFIDFPFVNTFIATYGYRNCSIKAAAEVIAGKITPRGRLPVTLKK